MTIQPSSQPNDQPVPNTEKVSAENRRAPDGDTEALCAGARRALTLLANLFSGCW